MKARKPDRLRRVAFSVSLPRVLFEQVDNLAQEQEKPRSRLIREAMIAYLQQGAVEEMGVIVRE